nr:MAG TPA: hypothetical protein [Caudoviricetes sp.]
MSAPLTSLVIKSLCMPRVQFGVSIIKLSSSLLYILNESYLCFLYQFLKY